MFNNSLNDSLYKIQLKHIKDCTESFLDIIKQYHQDAYGIYAKYLEKQCQQADLFTKEGE